MMSHGDPSVEPLCELLKESSALTLEESNQARAAFLARLEEQQRAEEARLFFGRRARSPLAAAFPLTAALLLAGLVTLVLVFWPDAALKYRVVGADEKGGYLRAVGSQAAQITFTDRTMLTAQPAARLRIMEVRAEGAHVLLEEGTLQAEVTHEKSTRWNFVAGPFDVHVTGTKFELSWDPRAERLLVDLERGSVEVSGADDFGPVLVRAGQQFVGDARAHTMQVRERDPEKDVVESGRTVPAPAGADFQLTPSAKEEALESSSESAAAEIRDQGKSQVSGKNLRAGDGASDAVGKDPSSSESGGASFHQLVAQGKFKEVVLAAREQGISRCLSVCSSAELMALADAARYTGEDGLVFDSLQAVRRRFPGGSAAKAAFLLGRTYEGRGSLTDARKWYEKALQEAPRGAFAEESLAGKMRTISAMNGKGAARPIAEQYLQLYPQGVHEGTARQILQP